MQPIRELGGRISNIKKSEVLPISIHVPLQILTLVFFYLTRPSLVGLATDLVNLEGVALKGLKNLYCTFYAVTAFAVLRFQDCNEGDPAFSFSKSTSCF